MIILILYPIPVGIAEEVPTCQAKAEPETGEISTKSYFISIDKVPGLMHPPLLGPFYLVRFFSHNDAFVDVLSLS